MSIDRRSFLTRFSAGFGAVALTQMLARGATAGKAKAVILLFMQGGPSHLETFDPKPALKKLDGQALPASFDAAGLPLQFMKASDGKLMASPFQFRRCGKSGVEISEVFPRLGGCADDLAVVRSCYHDSFIHGPALTLLQTGSTLLGHPSVGSWVVYGLGRESDSLPAYLVMSDGAIRNSAALYSNGFLPAAYQGTLLGTEGAPIQNLRPPAGMSAREQRKLLDRLREFNREHAAGREDDSRLEARVAAYELAFRMQSAAPELIDLSREPAPV